MSGHDELVLIPEEEIDISDISENESSAKNTETINDHSVEMVGYFIRDFEPSTRVPIGCYIWSFEFTSFDRPIELFSQ